MTVRVKRRPTKVGRHCLFITLAVLLALDGSARADLLLLDVCMKQCSKADLEAIGNLRHVFKYNVPSHYTAATPEEVLARIGDNVPRPGIQDPLLTTEKFEQHLKQGIEKWMTAHVNDARENEEAAKSLGQALLEATENPWVAYYDPRFQTLIQRAYIGRAICLLRLKRTDEAKNAIADFVRATPEGSILDSYGTDAEGVFQLSRKELLQRGPGSLTIQVDDPSVAFYINTTGQPHKGVFAADTMLPGTYQVFMTDGTQSRRFYTTVKPRARATLNVVWQREIAFETPSAQRPRIGFNFNSDAERKLEAKYASHIAALMPGALVIVVGRIIWHGKEALIGAEYGPEDSVASRVGVIVGTDAVSAQHLATYLVTTRMPPRVVPLAAVPWATPSPAPPSAESGPSESPAAWFIAGGVAGVLAGITLYAIDARGRRTAPYGFATGILGGAAAGTGFGLLLGGEASTAAPRAVPAGPALSIGPSQAIVGWGGEF